MFQFVSGELADRMIEALTDRARAGVRVMVMLDAFGSWQLKKGDRHRLSESGVEVRVFRPFHWRLLYKLQDRMHLRSVVIDGAIGWTGGFGIDDRWRGNGRRAGEWRDTNARLLGPAVHQLQAAFSVNWAETTASLLMGNEIFPSPDTSAEGAVCGLMHSAPSLGSTNAERYFVLSIDCAEKRLYVTNPYFIPDDDLRNLLKDAARRGVDVRILTPGANNDRVAVFHASRRHYEELLAAGICIWEYEPSMIHAKTIVADTLFFSIGTINFDNRSIMLNDEATLVGLSRRIAEELESAFLEDLGYAAEILLDEFRRRPLSNRIKERVAGLFQPIL